MAAAGSTPSPKPPGELPGPGSTTRKARGIEVSATKIFLFGLILLFLWFFYSIWTQDVTVTLGTIKLQWQMGWTIVAVFSLGFALGKIPFRLRM